MSSKDDRGKKVTVPSRVPMSIECKKKAKALEETIEKLEEKEKQEQKGYGLFQDEPTKNIYSGVG